MKITWLYFGTAALLATASCRSAPPLRGYTIEELKYCRGWQIKELPERRLPRIHGKVKDTGDFPVPGVILVLSSLGTSSTPLFVAVTSKQGAFTFGKVPPGKYILKTCFEGFDTIEMPVEIDAKAKDAPLELPINPSA